MRHRSWVLLTTALWLCGPALTPAQAQTAPAQNQIESYKPDFFASARPSTAMDMINRLPGFSFDGGDGSRGFSGNSGNVLIDGKRPTSKTDYLGAVLQRIVAADVERIDVIHGSAPGIDMQSKPVVANVILKKAPSTTIVTQASAAATTTGRIMSGGVLQYSHTTGERSYDLSIRRDPNYSNDMGTASITEIDPSGTAVTSGEVRRGSGGVIGLNGAVKTPLAGGDLSANTTLQQSDYSGGTDYDASANLQNYSFSSHNRNGELGANYQRALGVANLDVELLQRLGHATSTQLVDDSGVAERFSNLTDTGESISRFTLSYPLTPHLSLEGGAEAAYNFLTGTSLYTQNGTVVTVPSSDVNVNEMREEVFAQASWRIGRALVLDTGLRTEYSTISERGDVSQSRSFFYLKPRALLTWTMSPNALLRFRVEHQLGQLDFGDFISSVSLNQGNVTAGNPDVKPDQHWQFEAAYERHFWDRGSLTVSLLHQEISNILDMKPVFDPSGDYDTRGNIGGGRVDRLSVTGAIPTDKFRPLKGGRITLSLAWQDSAVKDPLTGVTRRLTYDDAASYSVGFVQDMEEWKSTWSVNYNNGWKEIGFRLAEVDRFFGDPGVSAGWTYKPSANLNIGFSINNFLIARRTRISDYYAGARDVSALTRTEIETGYGRPTFNFSIRKTFN